jgi:hypothetical protein
MGSLYLNRLKRSEYEELVRATWEAQSGRCFICEQPIDLDLHHDAVDLDHVVPLATGGRDDPSNFALTHASCNRSKQASDLRVARILARFDQLRAACEPQPNRPNLSDVLQLVGGARYDLPIRLKDGAVQLTFPDTGSVEVREVPLYQDRLSGFNYFFAVLPVAYVRHDERINPRAIAPASLRRMVEEFQAGLPQLHPAVAWTQVPNPSGRASVYVFDGQHKAAAQVFLGVTELPLRVFVNPDLDRLLTANTHAGTTLRQVAFDKSVQRRLGSQLFEDLLKQYRSHLGLPEDALGFSEQDLLNHFKGQRKEALRYILDNVRDQITHHPDNRLKSYIDFGGRGTERPLSYSTVERTFYSFFIYPDALSTPLDYGLDTGENPRQLEIDQILRLMNLIADRIYIGQYDPSIGTYQLEHKVQSGDQSIPPSHLRAYRMSKEEVLFNWLRLVKTIVQTHFAFHGTVLDERRLFQKRFPEPLWDYIDRFIQNLAQMAFWVNPALSATVFGAKQTHQYWQYIFETGRTQQGQQVLPEPIQVMKLIQ